MKTLKKAFTDAVPGNNMNEFPDKYLDVNNVMAVVYFDNGIKVTIPDSWEEEKWDNLISLYDPVEGVGVLQFSLSTAGPDPIDLSKELEEYLGDKHDSVDIKQLANSAYVIFPKNSYINKCSI